MQIITDFFTSIGHFFSSFWDIVVYVFKELKALFILLKAGLQFWLDMLGTMPVVFLGFGVAMITVLLLYVIIGRTAGGD